MVYSSLFTYCLSYFVNVDSLSILKYKEGVSWPTPEMADLVRLLFNLCKYVGGGGVKNAVWCFIFDLGNSGEFSVHDLGNLEKTAGNTDPDTKTKGIRRSTGQTFTFATSVTGSALSQYWPGSRSPYRCNPNNHRGARNTARVLMIPTRPFPYTKYGG